MAIYLHDDKGQRHEVPDPSVFQHGTAEDVLDDMFHGDEHNIVKVTVNESLVIWEK